MFFFVTIFKIKNVMLTIKKHFLNLSVLFAAAILLSGCVTSNQNNPCGIVSAYLEPTRAENLYRAVVTNLDGKSVISQPNYQLPPGRHIFTLVELIDAPELDIPLSQRTAKQLEIIVKPNTRYHIAARYLPEGQGEDFWQPLVWQQDHARCQFVHPEIEE